MTDIALTVPDTAKEPAPKRRRRLLKLALPLVLGGAGFASTYIGLWSPSALLGLSALQQAQTTPTGTTAFIDLPAINLTIPDARPRMLHLVVKLEVDEAHAKEVQRLLPRVLDTFNTFLTGIAPEAFERRGILEIVREELRTRVLLALESRIPVGVLIMEFALK